MEHITLTGKAKMPDYIEIKFKGERKAVFHNPLQLPFRPGDYAIVEAEKGEDCGRVNNLHPTRKQIEECKEQKRKILRKALPADIIKIRQKQSNESRALDSCRNKVKKHNLNMKLVDCEYQFDGNKITFYFTAEKRVDFRELVKDLAGEYRTRIELRQIGVRDEAKRLGGYGVCGRKLCCAAWIKEFKPISTQAAKEQNLPLNPNKLAGSCGRLKCCLIFERDFYNWAVTAFPELAKPITTSRGKGIVHRIDIFKETIDVRYPDEEIETLSITELEKNGYRCDKNCADKPAQNGGKKDNKKKDSK